MSQIFVEPCRTALMVCGILSVFIARSELIKEVSMVSVLPNALVDLSFFKLGVGRVKRNRPMLAR